MAGEFLTQLGADVAALLGVLGEFLDLCTIEQPTLTDDGHGGKAQDWAALNTDPLPCIAYPGTARKELLAQVPTGMTAYTVVVKGGIAVAGTNRVKVLARGAEPERLVKIVGVLPQMGVITEIVGAVRI